MRKNNNTQKIVGLGLFTASVIVLQLMGSFIRFGTFSISLVLVPVVIGAALYGAGAGEWLGFGFGWSCCSAATRRRSSVSTRSARS